MKIRKCECFRGRNRTDCGNNSPCREKEVPPCMTQECGMPIEMSQVTQEVPRSVPFIVNVTKTTARRFPTSSKSAQTDFQSVQGGMFMRENQSWIWSQSKGEGCDRSSRESRSGQHLKLLLKLSRVSLQSGVCSTGKCLCSSVEV